MDKKTAAVIVIVVLAACGVAYAADPIGRRVIYNDTFGGRVTRFSDGRVDCYVHEAVKGDGFSCVVVR